MRLYKYRGVPVIESDFLLAWNKRARGFAALYFIIHKIPDGFIGGVEYIYSKSGSKSVERVLKHEYKHIEQMREHGRIKFVWKYMTDKEFHKQQEDEAKRAEHE